MPASVLQCAMCVCLVLPCTPPVCVGPGLILSSALSVQQLCSCAPALTDLYLNWVQAEEFGRRLAHQFPWSPAASVAVGLALRRRYQGHSGAPSMAAHRKQIIRVSLCCLPQCLFPVFLLCAWNIAFVMACVWSCLWACTQASRLESPRSCEDFPFVMSFSRLARLTECWQQTLDWQMVRVQPRSVASNPGNLMNSPRKNCCSYHSL